MTREEAIEVLQQDIPCEQDTDFIEALEMAIKALKRRPCPYSTKDGYCRHNGIAETIPTEQEPSREAFKQVMWERDIAIEQLHELGYELGQKIEPSGDLISRQAVEDAIYDYSRSCDVNYEQIMEYIDNLPPVNPQEPKWIPVSEGLPDTDDEVLCWYEYYHWKQEKVLPEYGIGCYLKETSSWFGEVANGHKVRVIAWTPLPKPYEPQESEG